PTKPQNSVQQVYASILPRLGSVDRAKSSQSVSHEIDGCKQAKFDAVTKDREPARPNELNKSSEQFRNFVPIISAAKTQEVLLIPTLNKTATPKVRKPQQFPPEIFFL